MPFVVDTSVTMAWCFEARPRPRAYDAAYLELAERLGTPLATLDGHLASACRAAGVVLLGT